MVASKQNPLDREIASAAQHRTWRLAVASDRSVLALLAFAVVLLHTLANGQYGFLHDEWATLDDAHHLDWGYVVYPPLTPFLGRVELVLFGTSLRGFRFFPAVAQGIVLLLTGLAARELGGKRQAQLLAAAGVGIGGAAMFDGGYLSYTSLDYPWWPVVGYLAIRLLKSDNPRWWAAIGAAIGAGMMTKYTMIFLTSGVVVGVLLTPARRYLKSPWLWCGAAIAFLIWLPNLLWQIQHHFVSLEFLRSIHARDVAAGRANGFMLAQLWKSTHPVTVPIWGAGLWTLFATPTGKRYRMLGWMFVVPLLALFAAKGRDYYLAPAYPMLMAAGAVWGERWMGSLSTGAAVTVRQTTVWALATGGLVTAAVTLPLAPVNSAWWRVADAMNGNFNMEFGYQETVETVSKIRDTLPVQERGRLGILAGDAGMAAAINQLGPAYGLPKAISGQNSDWLRGYGDPPPETLIVVSMDRDFLFRNFESCALAGRLTNRYGIENSAMTGYTDVFVCRHLRQPWPVFWKHFQYFG